jgi:hypothetical protein
MDEHGPTRTEHEVDVGFARDLDTVINKAYMDGIGINGDWARYNAQVIAAAASRGLITTETSAGQYGRVWRPTYEGIVWVQAGKVPEL